MASKTFRRRPIEVTAEQWQPGASVEGVEKFTPKRGIIWQGEAEADLVFPGDYVVKGYDGRLYPVRQEEFEAEYELVGEGNGQE